ncbi:MAG: hypothetical protein BRC25_02015 [Parcubacteria group bacterium SW_6_46_9]|nr:MAG: hypothetical protein BRC25_02015 [Parcubacteria group bacterium SW_6_46_9]
MNSVYQITAGVVLLAVLAVGGYVFYTQSDSNIGELTRNVSGSLQATTTLDADQSQTLQRLNELEDITIDTEFLRSDAFRSLKNFGIAIEPKSVGRPNPFAPAGVVDPADVSKIDANMDIDLSDPQDSATSSQGTTSVDQLLEAGNQDQGSATSSTNEGS